MERQALLAPYIPPLALSYCEQLWQQYNFDLRITRPRRTRLGDFSVKPKARPRITVNVNLNPYSFLITYLHEVAHCAVFATHKCRVAPHGPEWQKSFRELLQPVLTEAIFPPSVLLPLRRYALAPKASTGSDLPLLHALRQYDAPLPDHNKVPLLHLNEGCDFVFQQREFTRGVLRRTRVLCTEKTSQRRYTIPAHALVETR
ncbi:hypothetical protein GCM10027275_01280 [Rhabdobacter roseus]|uniref:SprT-like domain-containing protein n=1 Tax=Rhabdobacter roseus TaxID=1655419 RepID=A0A840TKD1_9BACT|nr:SprT-like domain-containing protein [Rhabdobacter roseus]MBB5282012.1 hypothetical protein [Rhabdobacter roseus]